MKERHIKIQLIKFSLYGFFKNLRFFDPFLLLYLTYNNISLTHIGILFAIREAIIYIFEVPSGVFADKFGRKTELIICFIFYIMSFIIFYLGNGFHHFIIAFSLFGLGEAFRSGTHKAMIMDFMDYHNIKDNKSKIYGATRSYSMIGSMFSSILAIVLVRILPSISTLFLVAIIPYIFDLLLILSYPNYLNTKIEHKFSFKEFFQGSIVIISTTLKNKTLRSTLFDSATYNAIFKTIKDYIQIVIYAALITSFVKMDDATESIEINLALIYAGMFLLSALASRLSHRFLKMSSRDNILNYIWLLTALISSLIIIFNNSLYTTIGLFSLFHVLLNIRKPIMIEKIGDMADSSQRATILSVESQITSLVIIVMAPLFGFVYDRWNLQYVFILIVLFSLLFSLITYKKRNLSNT
ncbi:MFS transporter [Mycoplasmatota bacterium zrk1]